MPETAAPTRIGTYEIKKLIAMGRMGEVYQASRPNPKTGAAELFAVRVLNPKTATLQDWCHKFNTEVKDEHLIHYTEIGGDVTYQHFLATPFLEVRPASRQVFRWERSHEIVDAFVRVLQGLQEAHSKGFIHGNIKPSNVLVRRPKGAHAQALLADWGLSYRPEKELLGADHFDKVFPYMAPERIRQLAAAADAATIRMTPTADTYSMAVTLAETLAEARPFSGARSPEELVRLKRDKKYLMLHVNATIHHVEIQKLNEVLRRGMSYDVDSRFRSAEEMAAALQACVAVQEKKA